MAWSQEFALGTSRPTQAGCRYVGTVTAAPVKPARTPHIDSPPNKQRERTPRLGQCQEGMQMYALLG